MLWCVYRWKLWKWQRSRRKLVEAYQADYRKAVKSKLGNDALHDLKDAERWEVSLRNEEIETLTSDYLCEQASILQVPLPAWKSEDEQDGSWERTYQLQNWVLTRKGMAEVRAAIREEKAARHEVFLSWVTPLIGLIGALTGLIAIWKN